MGRFVPNLAGFRQLRREAMADTIHDRARRIADAAGGEDEGYFVHDGSDAKRARARVVAGWNQSVAAELRDGTLTRAVDAGRGDTHG